jgi:uncharacterized protein (TIGR02284 family)
MDNLKKILEVLNDLIRINKDREAGYTKVGRELTPAEHNLRSAFERKAMESRNNISTLEHMADEIQLQLDDYESKAENVYRESFAGRIYNIWTEVKDFFTGKDKSSLLRSCVDGEAKAKTCYEKALDAAEYPEEISRVLNEQKSSIDQSKLEMTNLLEANKF